MQTACTRKVCRIIMKAKSFHCSKSGVAQPIAAAIGTKLQCVCDKLPPAYPSDGEKVVFVGVEMKGSVPGPVEQFCKDLTPARTKYVAFYVINGTGDTSGLDGVIATMEKNGVKKVGETLGITVKSSLFHKGTVTEADIQKAIDWATKIIETP